MNVVWITLCISCEYPVDSIVLSTAWVTCYQLHFTRAITCSGRWKDALPWALRGSSNYVTLTITIKKGSRLVGQKLISDQSEAVKSGRQEGLWQGQGSVDSSRLGMPPLGTVTGRDEWRDRVRHKTESGRRSDGVHRARNYLERLRGTIGRTLGSWVVQRVQGAPAAHFNVLGGVSVTQSEARLGLLTAALAVAWANTRAYFIVSGPGVFALVGSARSVGFFGCAALVGHRGMVGAGITRSAMDREVGQ